MTNERPGTLRLTNPQRRVLQFLADAPHDLVAREVAERMWPDSEGWANRSRRYATAAGGALGVAMPMKAGVMLGLLRQRGLVDSEGYAPTRWSITAAGRRAIEEKP